jgi:lipopolysaccharide transport system permease protein
MTANTEPVPLPAASRVHTHIAPPRRWISLQLKLLWEYRELIYFFVWRELKVRYKQTIIGAGWAIIQPVLTMVIFSVFFGKLAKVPSGEVPYPIFSFTALVPWGYFTAVLTGTSASMLTNTHMIKKIYFPRLTIPLASTLAAGVDFLIQFAVLLGMIFAYEITPTSNVVWLPLLLLLTIITSMGVGLWLAIWNARFRDVRYAMGFLVQTWLFITPVAYPSSLIEDPLLLTLYGLNPMAGVVEGFRWALLGTGAAPTNMIFISSLVALVIFITGVYRFRRMENVFADIL